MKRICSVEGCPRPVRATGFCAGHLARYYKHGDPGPAEIRPRLKAPAECTVEGCDRTPRARGMCGTHEARWRKHGDPGPAELLRGAAGTCEASGCGRPWTTRRLCDRHYKRLQVHGDPEYRGNGNFRGDTAGYVGVHHRLRDQRGKAASYRCAHCGKTAAEWAYNHDDPDPAVRFDDAGRPYTVNLTYYIPLCVPCHKRFDSAGRKASA